MHYNLRRYASDKIRRKDAGVRDRPEQFRMRELLRPVTKEPEENADCNR